ncbi:MAG: hypothetical protein HY912_15645 [Desulfomonile tiedjei]|uniref:Uncharacterized protein n=1 Tax=Desulfomonile tiedjei TaxID=2358 RepID=A0A9D6Z7A5_9BACT|nr:hypothetical protein [Desulfomonile tiedjei]
MDYKIDRSLLESKSTEEILLILREERDDYTPEALEAFEEILAERGVPGSASPGLSPGKSAVRSASGLNATGDVLIRRPSDAVRVLNELLSGVLSGSIDPKVAEVSTNLVMAILRAMEQELMTEAEED